MIKILHVLEFYDQVSVDLNKNLEKYKSLDYKRAIKKAVDVNFSWNQLFNEKNKKYKFIKIYPSNYILQNIWAKTYFRNEIEDLKDIFLKQIDFYNPDIIFFQNIKFLKKILKLLPNNIKIYIWDGINYEENIFLGKRFSFLSNMNEVVKWYKKKGEKAFFVNHFFNDYKKRKKFKKIKKKYFLSFVGSISNKYHFDRTLFLYDLNKKIKINFFIGDSPNFYKSILICFFNFFIKGKNFFQCLKYVYAVQILKLSNKGSVFGDKMNKIIKESYLNINYHITSGSGLNMRCFEVLGNQSCLVSNGTELKKFFKNNEFIYYNNIHDCYKKISFLKNKTHLIKRISTNGYKKVSEKYSYSKNKKKIIKIFLNN